jgi:hypothetical protein
MSFVSDPTASKPEFLMMEKLLRSAKNSIERKSISSKLLTTFRIDETHKPPEEEPPSDGFTQQQLEQEQQQREHLDFLAKQTADVLEQEKVLSDVTEAVRDVINQGHITVESVDQIVAEAKEKMVEGNEDLNVAEREQTKRCQIS